MYIRTLRYRTGFPDSFGEKATETGHPLSGAQFKHIRPDGSEKILTTDEKGTLKVMPLSHGIHKLKEVKAPDGYRTNNNELIFQVDESGKQKFYLR